uniref:ORF2 n=1 Tax=uncultured bacterium esnapd14 TaxID=1366594 RepID=S5TLB6_9BACT|nr:ORF2 [uncultured bacterium esnapd14]
MVSADGVSLGEADKWRGLARKHEERAKANAAKAKKLEELEAKAASDLEKATVRAEAAEKRAQALLSRAVTAEVKALAAATLAEPGDAPLYLNLPGYISDDHGIDTEAIAADLAKVLEAKPHLAKPDPKRKPKPDVSQGPQLDTGADFTSASKETFAAELGKYGLRTRS